MNFYRALVRLAFSNTPTLEDYVFASTDAEAIAKFQVKGFSVLTLWRMVNIESTQ